jgi:hydroxyacylglutathione hydrolase
MMWVSLTKLAALPPETRVYSGHEYAESNARFATGLDPEDPAFKARAAAIAAARAEGRPTVPSTIAEEAASNPFLRARDPGLRARLGLDAMTEGEAFAEIRRRKDVA